MHPPAAAEPSADRSTLLLEFIGEGIFGIDLNGRCTFVNPAALQLLGHRTETVLGRNMHELVHHSHADGRHCAECDCPIFKAFRLGEPCRIDDEVLWRADGTPFHAEYASHPILDQGRVVGAVVSFVDIGERKRRSLAAAHQRRAGSPGRRPHGSAERGPGPAARTGQPRRGGPRAGAHAHCTRGP